MGKLTVVAAFALGYVAGSAAGRERYETIKAGAQRVTGDPRVRAAATKAATTVKDTAVATAPVVAEQVKDATSAVADKVRSTDDEADHDPAPGPPEPATGRTPLS
jgi:hypothetical protein